MENILQWSLGVTRPEWEASWSCTPNQPLATIAATIAATVAMVARPTGARWALSKGKRQPSIAMAAALVARVTAMVSMVTAMVAMVTAMVAMVTRF